MVCPKYKDIGKTANDFFDKGFEPSSSFSFSRVATRLRELKVRRGGEA